jgi:hypothetical protein
MKMTVLALTCAVATMTATTTMAMDTACPEQAVTAPAISATGPYLIQDLGTAQAQVGGLPTCEAAMFHAGRMVEASPDVVVALVIAVADGTYAVELDALGD